MIEGREADEFFRRTGATLEESGGRVVDAGEAVALGPDVVHRVQNPLSHGSSSAFHVYGGNLLSVARSMWTKPGWKEEPFDEVRATGLVFES